MEKIYLKSEIDDYQYENAGESECVDPLIKSEDDKDDEQTPQINIKSEEASLLEGVIKQELFIDEPNCEPRTPSESSYVTQENNITNDEKALEETSLLKSTIKQEAFIDEPDCEVNIPLESSYVKQEDNITIDEEQYLVEEHTSSFDSEEKTLYSLDNIKQEVTAGKDVYNEILNENPEIAYSPTMDKVTKKHGRKGPNVNQLTEPKEENPPKKGTYICSICNKSFILFKWLVRHIKTHNEDESCECHICKKVFSNINNRNQHLRIHAMKKSFECIVCNKMFIQSRHLDVHMRTHTGERPYKCEECGKKFNRTSILNVHLRTHSGERPYECNICNKKFIDSSKLTIHIRTHTGEKPHKCEFCEKAFYTNSELHYHMQNHGQIVHNENVKCETSVKIRINECNACHRVFKQRSTLREHVLRKHTEEKLYKCIFCNKQFAHERFLRKHMLNHNKK